MIIVIAAVLLFVGGMLWWYVGVSETPNQPPRIFVQGIDGQQEEVVAMVGLSGGKHWVYLGSSLSGVLPKEVFLAQIPQVVQLVERVTGLAIQKDVLLIQRAVLPAQASDDARSATIVNFSPMIVIFQKYSTLNLVHEFAHAMLGRLQDTMPDVAREGIPVFCESLLEGEGGDKHYDFTVNFSEMNTPGMTAVDGMFEDALASLQYRAAGALFFRLYEQDPLFIRKLMQKVQEKKLPDWRAYQEFLRTALGGALYGETFLVQGFVPGSYVMRTKSPAYKMQEDSFFFFERNARGTIIATSFDVVPDRGDIFHITTSGVDQRSGNIREQFPNARTLTVLDRQGKVIRTINLMD